MIENTLSGRFDKLNVNSSPKEIPCLDTNELKYRLRQSVVLSPEMAIDLFTSPAPKLTKVEIKKASLPDLLDRVRVRGNFTGLSPSHT